MVMQLQLKLVVFCDFGEANQQLCFRHSFENFNNFNLCMILAVYRISLSV